VEETRARLTEAPAAGATGRWAPRLAESAGSVEHVLVPLEHEPDRDGDRAPELPADHADLDPVVVGRRSLRQSLQPAILTSV
jgi:hypothetical protein